MSDSGDPSLAVHPSRPVSETTAVQTPADRLRVVSTSVRSARTEISALDVWAFVLPALSFLQFALVGKLIASEALALVLLPWLLRARDRIHAPRWMIVLWAAWFASQVVTDLLVRSAFSDWARGWAAIAFTLVNLLAILTLAATPRRARIFAFGLAAGGIVGYFVAPNVYAASDAWKWAFAAPIGYVLAAALSNGWVSRRPWVPIVVFALFGVVNALLQYRALSGASLLTSAYLVVAELIGRRERFARPSLVRAAVGFVSYGAAGAAVFLALNAAAAGGVLGEAARTKYDSQAGVVTPSAQPGVIATATPVNPLGVIAGGRAEILSSTQAIRDSPIFGHGSWARDPKYVELQTKGLLDLGIPGGNEPTDPTLIPTHSYLTGSWVWAGLAGGVFWLAIAALALWVLANLFAIRTALKPLIIFVATWLLWNIAFSPYANTERLFATFGVTVCLLGLQVIRQAAGSMAIPKASTADPAAAGIGRSERQPQ